MQRLLVVLNSAAAQKVPVVARLCPSEPGLSTAARQLILLKNSEVAAGLFQ
jgi:hypothetical protein